MERKMHINAHYEIKLTIPIISDIFSLNSKVKNMMTT